MDYKVSVIIPVYNAEKTLERAFLSVKNQTIGFENIEFLLCDDCSTDGSYALIQKWAEEYPNVKAFKTKKNSGAPGTPRNLGLDNATAPYIMFLDNDDEYLPTACEILYKEIVGNNEVDIVSGETAFDENLKQTGLETKKVLLEGCKTEQYLDFFMTCIWTKIYRRAVIEEHGIRYPSGFCEDVVFSLMYLTVCRYGSLIKAPIVLYTVRSDSASHTKNERYYRIIPDSIIYGLDKTNGYQRDKQYLDVLGHICFVDGYIEELLEQDFSPKEMEAIFNIWEPMLSLCSSGRLNSKSPYAEILIRDMCVLKDTEKTLSDFYLLKKINAVQKAQLEEEKLQRRKELEDIYGSTTWKVASALQKLKFWSK